QRGVTQVGIGRGIGRTILDPFGLGTLAEGRDANSRAAVPGRVGQVDRRLVAGNQPFVGVGGGAAQRAQRFGVFQQPADVVQGQVAQAGVFIARKEGLVLLPQTLVGVHARAV